MLHDFLSLPDEILGLVCQELMPEWSKVETIDEDEEVLAESEMDKLKTLLNLLCVSKRIKQIAAPYAWAYPSFELGYNWHSVSEETAALAKIVWFAEVVWMDRIDDYFVFWQDALDKFPNAHIVCACWSLAVAGTDRSELKCGNDRALGLVGYRIRLCARDEELRVTSLVRERLGWTCYLQLPPVKYNYRLPFKPFSWIVNAEGPVDLDDLPCVREWCLNDGRANTISTIWRGQDERPGSVIVQDLALQVNHVASLMSKKIQGLRMHFEIRDILWDIKDIEHPAVKALVAAAEALKDAVNCLLFKIEIWAVSVDVDDPKLEICLDYEVPQVVVRR